MPSLTATTTAACASNDTKVEALLTSDAASSEANSPNAAPVDSASPTTTGIEASRIVAKKESYHVASAKNNLSNNTDKIEKEEKEKSTIPTTAKLANVKVDELFVS